MTVTGVHSSLQVRDSMLLDPELQILKHVIRVAGEVGIRTDPASIVNLYVALKTKPMAILAGIAHSGKIALIQTLVQALIGDDLFRCQMMNGHAWWASQTGNVAFFTDLQARLNADKMLNLIEEARRPENAHRVHIACLTRISPGELTGFFSELAGQLRHGPIVQLPGLALTEPIPYPPNLLLIGTMDTVQFDWHDVDLLAKTTVIQWPAVESKLVDAHSTVTARDNDSEFLSSRVGDEWSARQKLLRILGGEAYGLRPVLQIGDLLKAHHALLPDSAIGEAVVYLANAWSKQGVGLFDAVNSRNITIAVDLAIAQTLLPRAAEAIRSLATLRDQLIHRLHPFPHSLAFIENVN